MKKKVIDEIVRVCDKEILAKMWGSKLAIVPKGILLDI